MSKRREDGETKKALHLVVEEMYNNMVKGNPPSMTLPVRTKKNIQFNDKLNVYKYGKKRSTRNAVDLGSAKQLLRTLHVIECIDEMVQNGKTSTLR